MLPFAVMFPQIALGAYIAFSHAAGLLPYYDHHAGELFAYSISAAYDQHVGGIVVWIPAGMMSAIGFMTALNALRIYEDNMPEDDEYDGTGIVVDTSAWTGRQRSTAARGICSATAATDSLAISHPWLMRYVTPGDTSRRILHPDQQQRPSGCC